MDKLILITLLIKLGVAAAIASALVRSRDYQNLLFTEERSLAQRVYLVLFTCLPFALGVVVRTTTPNFLAADLTFEAVILMGVVGENSPASLPALSALYRQRYTVSTWRCLSMYWLG